MPRLFSHPFGAPSINAISGVMLSMLLAPCVALAEAPRVLPAGQLPNDRRLEPLKDLDGYFPFTPSESKEAWATRAERVRRQILVANGLWPMPTKTPLNAVVHGAIDLGDYTVEKAYFESMPGFYVTGSLYRPKGKSGKLPGVLCPHGHWANGRFYDNSLAAVEKEIESGAEQFVSNGRSPLQARCVHLAKMGCVVFHYDMIGYADNTQISYEVAHRFAKQRPEMNTTENWGLFSPQAEAHLQSVMGLQTYNSIRALDFLSELPDVDTSRLAVTGASGGGTQTMILGAIDPRVAVSFPAVMVSTAMQGGCTCENCSSLRIDTGNIEFAAMFAPKPLAMSAADDWTVEMTTKGFPELKKHYGLFDAADNVMLVSRTEFKHNYNSVTRHAMYHWFNKHLKLGVEEPIQETEITLLTQEQMTVWDADHPKPKGGDEFERELLSHWDIDTQEQLIALLPTDSSSLSKYREVVGGGVDIAIGRGLPAADDVEVEQIDETDQGSYLQVLGLLRNKPVGEELPVVFLHPHDWKGRVVVWLDKDGKAGLFDEAGSPKPEIIQLIDAGVTVIGVDLLYQGEFLADGKPLEQTGRVTNPREAACYTFGYNHTVFAKRVHDVLTVLSFAKHHELQPKQIDLVGLAGAGHWAAAAAAQSRGVLHALAIDTQLFRFSSVRDLHSPDFLPGGAKYDDLFGMLSLAAPTPLWFHEESALVTWPISAAYHAERVTANFHRSSDSSAASAVTWLLEQ
ncbi:MAG: acetylxylan esterase [Planctomycetaceae bacterium]|nr:acetylxylan esterase [Planctomycetaceae bacterium]